MFNNEDLKNISALINLAQIKGQDAMTVARLQQKIAGLITPEVKNEEEGKETKTGK